MPIWLRKFTIQSMNEYYEKQNKEAEKAQKKQNKPLARGPAIKSPTYSTKARK